MRWNGADVVRNEYPTFVSRQSQDDGIGKSVETGIIRIQKIDCPFSMANT